MGKSCDVAIIGGGPGGATAGYYLARAGLNAVIVERQDFPRYCVGESLLPHNMEIFRDMAFDEVLEREGFLRKYGAVFGEADGSRISRINFRDGLVPECEYAYQAPRDRFDTLLLEHAKGAGAEVVAGTVNDLVTENDRVVGVEISARDGSHDRLRAQIVIDASGRQTFIGRKLGLMEPDPVIDTMSVFGVFRGVAPPELAEGGDIVILGFASGWFWFIPFADGRTSVGLVVDRAWYEDSPESDMEAFFDRTVARKGNSCARGMLADAERIGDLHLLANFNRRARNFAGRGWVLVGDAAMFIDPVFSAGVLLATIEGKAAAETIAPLLARRQSVEPGHFDAYSHTVRAGYTILERYIYGWKDPAFRRFFLRPPESGRAVQTVTTILGGNVFDPELIGRGDMPLFVLAALYRLWLRFRAPFDSVMDWRHGASSAG